MATNFEPNECVNFAQSMKIGTHDVTKIKPSTVIIINDPKNYIFIIMSCFFTISRVLCADL